jgi:4'-phosphopantetheinyl transferase
VSVPHRAFVWLLDADALRDETLASCSAWLDVSERQRLARFIRPARRRQFLAGRALARLALAHVLGIRAEDVRLEDRAGSPPLLASPLAEEAGFSISHSGRWVACAASSSSKVGLDIELVDTRRDIDALAAQAFDAAQCAWLASRPAASRLRDFYSLWSAAEARFKLGRPAGACFDLSTPELSIVLCCEQVISPAPEVQVQTLNF